MSTIFIDERSQIALKNNHRPWYNEIGKDPENYNFHEYENNKDVQTIQEYSNVLLSKYGSMILVTTGEKIIHGYGGQFFPITNNNQIKLYDNIITFSGYWSSGVWHFPMETLVNLRTIFNKIPTELRKQYYLYFDEISNTDKNWIDLFSQELSKFAGILTSASLSDNNIIASKLLAPQRPRFGNPNSKQIEWLKDHIWRKLNLSETGRQTCIILIKRNFLRVLKNFSEVQKEVSKFAELTNLELYIHDDKNLPPFEEQLKIFHKARYVIGSHGAGAVNLLACHGEQKTTFVEFLNLTDINICYLRLAKFLEINYYSVPIFNNDKACLETLENFTKLEQSRLS